MNQTCGVTVYPRRYKPSQALPAVAMAFPPHKFITIPFSQKPLISTLSGNLLILDVDSEAPLEGTYTWDAARKELVFAPTQPFTAEAPYNSCFVRVPPAYSQKRARRSRPRFFFRIVCTERDYIMIVPLSFPIISISKISQRALAFQRTISLSPTASPSPPIRRFKGPFSFLKAHSPTTRTGSVTTGGPLLQSGFIHKKSRPSWLISKLKSKLKNAFSLTGGIFIALDNANNPVDLTDETKSALFFNSDTIREHVDIERQSFAEPHLLHVRPDLALEPDTTYVYRLLDFTDRGQDVVPQERLPILVGPDIVNADGSINVPGLSVEQATTLSALQNTLRPYLSQWERDGLDMLSLTGLGEFSTLSATEIFTARQNEVQEQPLDLNFLITRN